MPEQIRCPDCDATLRVPDNLLGKSVKCPKCQMTFTAELDEPAEPERITKEPSRASSPRPSPPAEEDEDEEVPPEDEDEERPRRRRRRGRRSSAEAESAVAGPAIALMVVGGIAIGLSILGLVLNLLGVGAMAAANPRGMAGPQQADSAARMFGSVVGTVVGLCYGGIIMTGAMKMKNLSSYGYAMTSCIVAMLPCSLCCLLGLPFGIWGLVVLNKPEVKDAFS
jgi:predicted Zn finger-like uncharacterized protein